MKLKSNKFDLFDYNTKQIESQLKFQTKILKKFKKNFEIFLKLRG